MDKQKLMQERENFIRLVNGLDKRVRKEEMKKNEADFMIKSITKGSTAKAYLYELNKKIDSMQDKQSSFKYKKQVILSAAIVMIFTMLLYSLTEPSLTGFVAFEQNIEYTLPVEQNYTAGTTEYYSSVTADSNNTNNLTSLRITGTYAGQFVMKLISDSGGRE